MTRLTNEDCDFYNSPEEENFDAFDSVDFIYDLYEELKKYENFMEENDFENLDELKKEMKKSGGNMGLSVCNQVDTKRYFSLSTIDKNRMAENEITISIQELRRRAKITAPHAEIITGQTCGHCRLTKIWRYEDFK